MTYFLIHPAGGSSLTMKGIHACLKNNNNGNKVVSLDLPGHGNLMEEALLYDFDTAVGYIARIIKNSLEDSSEAFSIIGHSMGGLLAYAVEHRLERNYNLRADTVFIMASSSPDLPAGSFIKNPQDISDDDLVAEVFKMGGIPDSVLSSKELLNILCPILRADFILLDSYIPRKMEGNAIKSNMVVMTGDADKIITEKEIENWKKFTFGNFREVGFEGNHFFYQQCEQVVYNEIIK